MIFSSSTTGNNFQKLAYIDVPSGSVGTAHVHLGKKVVFTLKGRDAEYLSDQTTVFTPGNSGH